MTGHTPIAPTRRAIVSGAGTVAALAGGDACSAGETGAPGPTTRTSDSVIGVKELGATILADDTAGLGVGDLARTLVLTLPPAAEAGPGRRARILKIGRKNFTRVKCAGHDLIGPDGPAFAVAGVANDGKGGCRIKWGNQVGGAGGAQTSLFRRGQKARVSGVQGVAAANGIWPVSQPLDDRYGPTYADLLGSRFSGAYAGGGVIQFVRTDLVLLTPGACVELESDGAERWYVVGGTAPNEIFPDRDLIAGYVEALPSADEDARREFYNGWGSLGGSTAVGLGVDFLYDVRAGRGRSRSWLFTEIGDPVDIKMTRAHTLDGQGAWPYGPKSVACTNGENIGSLYGAPYLGYGQGTPRTAQIAFICAEDLSPTRQGTYAEICATPVGSTRMVRQAKFRGDTIGFGTDEKVGLVNIRRNDDDAGVLFAKAADPRFSHAVVRLQTNRDPSPAFRMLSANAGGNDVFWIDGRGGAASDAGASMTTPADYAEMVREWWDGNPKGEDRAGCSVVLVRRSDPDKLVLPGEDEAGDTLIRLARTLPRRPLEAIIGVVSANPAVKGASGELHWALKFERDPFGRIVQEDCETVSWIEHRVRDMARSSEPPEYAVSDEPRVHFADRLEGVEVPPATGESIDQALTRAKAEGRRGEFVLTSSPVVAPARRPRLNPAFDPALTYVRREDRPEWDYVGLVGRLALRKGEPRHPRWIKTGDLAPDVAEWLVR